MNKPAEPNGEQFDPLRLSLETIAVKKGGKELYQSQVAQLSASDWVQDCETFDRKSGLSIEVRVEGHTLSIKDRGGSMMISPYNPKGRAAEYITGYCRTSAYAGSMD